MNNGTIASVLFLLYNSLTHKKIKVTCVLDNTFSYFVFRSGNVNRSKQSHVNPRVSKQHTVVAFLKKSVFLNRLSE